MRNLVTSIDAGRLGAVMSRLQEAQVGQVRLRQGPPAPGPSGQERRKKPARLILEIAVPEDRLHPAIEALAAGGGLPGDPSAILLRQRANA